MKNYSTGKNKQKGSDVVKSKKSKSVLNSEQGKQDYVRLL